MIFINRNCQKPVDSCFCCYLFDVSVKNTECPCLFIFFINKNQNQKCTGTFFFCEAVFALGRNILSDKCYLLLFSFLKLGTFYEIKVKGGSFVPASSIHNKKKISSDSLDARWLLKNNLLKKFLACV